LQAGHCDCKQKSIISPITRISRRVETYSAQSEATLNTAPSIWGGLVAEADSARAPLREVPRRRSLRSPRLGALGLSPAFSLAVVELRRLSRCREPRQLLSTEISTAGDAQLRLLPVLRLALRGEGLSRLDRNAVETRRPVSKSKPSPRRLLAVVGALRRCLFSQFLEFFSQRFMGGGPYPRQCGCGV
jgi:hypothetical protein